MIDKLMSAGCEVVAGTVFHKRTEVAKFSGGELLLLPEGEALLAELAPAPAPPKASKAKPKAEAPPAVNDDLAGLDGLLGD